MSPTIHQWLPRRLRRLALTVMALCAIVTTTCYADLSSGPAVAQIDPQIVQLGVTEGDDLRFVRLSRAQGLSQQRVTHIVQDGRGFLWFGTQYGLNRYDGYQFRVFKNDPADPESLCDVHITALFKDRAGHLWVGCAYSVDRYDPVTETFVHYRLEQSAAAHTSGDVRHISEDREGHLWLSTGYGLYRLDPQSGLVRRFVHEAANANSLSSSVIKFSGEDRAGAFWVATAAGLDRFDPRSARVTLRVPIPETRSLKFYEDRAGTFWILGESGPGLAILDRRTQRLVRYSFADKEVPGLPLTGVTSMLEDQEGTLWVGTVADGLLKFDRSRQRLTRYRNDPTNIESLTENRITTLLEDREGHIWTGFGATEPGFFTRSPSPFTKLPTDVRNPNNLGETLVNVIYEDRHGILWMGTTGALNRLDRSSGQLTHFDIPGQGIAADVLAIIDDPSSDALWVGTGGQGLYRLDTTTHRLQAFRHDSKDPTSLSDNRVIRLFTDSRKQLWIGTYDGLNQFDPATQTFVTYRHGKPETQHVYRSIVEDARGILWTDADGDGVQQFNPDTGHFTRVQLQPANESPLLYKRVLSLYIDRVGALWAGTGNGLFRHDIETGTSRYYSERDGLPSNAVSCAFEDASGQLWLGTSAGLSRLNRERRVFKNYSPADGLPGLDFTGFSACYRGASGDMFFGGFAGAVAFRPENLREIDSPLPVALTGFQLADVSVTPGSSSLLSRAIDYTSAITLSHSQSSFSIEFAALGFRSPSTNRYRHRLAGLENSWHEVGSDRRFASYTRLPPGQYRFQVQAATSRGSWGEPGAEVAIEIRPPWWGTWWFRGLLVLLGLAVIRALYILRIRQIAHGFDIRLEERVSERTRIARELHDSLLQSFQGLIFRLQAVHALLPDRTPEAAALLEKSLDHGDRAIAEARSAVHDLRSNAPVASDLSDALTALGQELCDDGLGSHSFRVVVEGAARPIAPLVRDEVYRIAREALRNAAQHSQARHIEAELHYGENAFVLRLRDDGVGIDANVVHEAQRAGHWGLQGMRERAEALGARLDVWSELNAGTEIELSIPAPIAYPRAGTHRSWFRLSALWKRS
ncbi:two-component regulator propeller domain-containing protein [Steroidobacter flavus]|uniref:Two-component regulator propeller domain-containing protein n=1 Tax=Steroidobacter flavus TaxID=1842136 RepID=A0ABV8SXS0_9GAMM